jgi:hypothetical protein
MTSFGETDLLLGNRIAGKVRVLGVHHGQALFPRLAFGLGIALHDFPATAFPSSDPLEGYEIRGLGGELRLDENARAVGALTWIGGRQNIRSSRHGSENQIVLACDLDWPRFEAIEENRSGNEAIFWLCLWPTVVKGAEYLDSEVRTFRVQVPRETWLKYIEPLTGLRHELVEIPIPSASTSEFLAATKHIAEARRRVDTGDFDEAVICCRRSMEATFVALNLKNDARELETLLAPITDAGRAKAYASIVARIKELGNLTVHRGEASGMYRRVEAQFAVATTAHTIHLLAHLFLFRSGRSDA